MRPWNRNGHCIYVVVRACVYGISCSVHCVSNMKHIGGAQLRAGGHWCEWLSIRRKWDFVQCFLVHPNLTRIGAYPCIEIIGT
jgi:hypothetical protein